MISGWEDVTSQNRRLKVPGGWIYETWALNYENVIVGLACCFVPDPEYKWKV